MEYGYNKVNLLDDTQQVNIIITLNEMWKPIQMKKYSNQLVEKTMKSEKKLENRAIAHKVSNLIHQQAGFISQTIDDYTQRQNEREVLKEKVSQTRKKKERNLIIFIKIPTQ